MRKRTTTLAYLLLGASGAGVGLHPLFGASTSEGVIWSAGGTALRALASVSSASTASASYPPAISERNATRAFAVERRDATVEIRLPAGVEVEELFDLRQGAFLSATAPLGVHAPGSQGNPSRRELYLAMIDGQGLHELPAPSPGSGRLRENAVPFASPGGDLEGLAWLEGGDRQSYVIRYAAWNTLSWSEPLQVAAEAPGSQLALSSATLADGSKLLVWSRFDGQDDEIVAARFADGTWSAPQPIAAGNAVPDITPSVVAVADGALAAWSRYDGHDYRVVVARFDGKEWSPPFAAGPAGSTEPFWTPVRSPEDIVGRFIAAPDQASIWLTYATAAARGWEILTLDSSGHVLSHGSAAEAPTARPGLAPLGPDKVRLRWAAEERAVELRQSAR